jgi:acyl-CoA synthetase (AMP-forming)/AMP-acid ligase II
MNPLPLELATHPHILEVTVVARNHIKWGERPMAFVVLHPQHASKWAGRHHEFAADLKEHAKGKLPGFACPEWVEVVPELPVSYSHGFLPLFGANDVCQKTSTGKILKTELRKIVAKL